MKSTTQEQVGREEGKENTYLWVNMGGGFSFAATQLCLRFRFLCDPGFYVSPAGRGLSLFYCRLRVIGAMYSSEGLVLLRTSRSRGGSEWVLEGGGAGEAADETGLH